jgi:hypothetical protein
MRKGSKRLLRTGILTGLAYAGWRWYTAQAPASKDHISWESAPFPFPPVPRPSVPKVEAVAKVETVAKVEAVEPFTTPGADGSCPTTHPVKAKLASGIYHVPGGGNYERTKPDRCYVDAAAAEADGLRAAKR